VFFHRHYFKMIFAFILILGLINPILIGYVWALPVVYTLFGISWATTIAHIPQLGFLSWRQYDTDDYTYNSHFWNILLMGEGYHNTHHACPWLWNYALNKGEWDIAAWVVKLIGIPNDKSAKPFEAPRYGKALRQELANVRERLAAKEPGHHD
jgi:fatty-acid desaturase